MKVHSVFTAAMLTGLGACGGGGSGSGAANPPAPPPPPPPPGGVVEFSRVTSGSGIGYVHGYLTPTDDQIERLGGGVAAGDYDRDGDIDLFVVRGDIGPNQLYRNDGNNTFSELAAAAGVAYTKPGNQNYRLSGPTFADLDGDDDLDLFIGGFAGDPAFVFSNNGDGTFTDVTATSGLDGLTSVNTVSAAFGDYDKDGDLDMFLSHWGTPRDEQNPGDTEHLWENTGGRSSIRFESVSIQAGISQSIVRPVAGVFGRNHDYTFTPTFADVNDDGYPDILSVGDFKSTRLFLNNRDGTFADVTDENVIVDESGMGSAVGDYDNDGDLDWFVSSIKNDIIGQIVGNRLYRNDSGVYADATDAAGVSNGDWGWGSCFADFNNDGHLDIYHTNGWRNIATDTFFEIDASRLFISNKNGTFTNKSVEAGVNDQEQGRGIVCADFDNDGDIDIFQTHRDENNSASLYRNDMNGNNYVFVELEGKAPNMEACGARIYLTVGNSTQTREVTIGSNFTSQNPTRQHFGLGSASQIDTLRIVWPDGSEQSASDVAANQVLVYRQN